MILVIDNYDSFVYNVVQYIGEFIEDIKVVRNDKITIEEIKKLNPDAIIISPGPKRPEDANISIDVVKYFYNKKPILGICLGHQVIGYVYGGKIINAPQIVHGKKSKIKHFHDIIFKEIPEEFEGGRYHSLIISNESFPSDKLDIIAKTDDNIIMGVKVKGYPVYGFQFHPESILTEYGKTIIYNFLNYIVNPKLNDIKDYLNILINKGNLSEKESYKIFDSIMEGNLSSEQVSAFLMGLAMKGETIEEITGAIKAIKSKMIKINIPGINNLIDTCGTGGDKLHTFNISTAVAFVAAGGGAYIAKHGNKSVSSKSGSADVLKAFGIKIDTEKDKVIKSIKEAHIGFLFAPLYHPAFKNVASIRKNLKIRTIFNMLGPLVNPAEVKRQTLGIFSNKLTEKFARILKANGTERALIFSSEENMDEISPFSNTYITFLNNGEIKNFIFNPSKYGLKGGSINDLYANSVEESKKIIENILNNKCKNKTALNAVILNAAAALFIADNENNFENNFSLYIEKAIDSIEKLKALESLNKMSNIMK